MRTILASLINGINVPTEEFPKDALLVAFNGTEYVIYEEGDALPVADEATEELTES